MTRETTKIGISPPKMSTIGGSQQLKFCVGEVTLVLVVTGGCILAKEVTLVSASSIGSTGYVRPAQMANTKRFLTSRAVGSSICFLRDSALTF